MKKVKVNIFMLIHEIIHLIEDGYTNDAIKQLHRLMWVDPEDPNLYRNERQTVTKLRRIIYLIDGGYTEDAIQELRESQAKYIYSVERYRGQVPQGIGFREYTELQEWMSANNFNPWMMRPIYESERPFLYEQ